MTNRQKTAGFTVTELLLSIAIVAVVAMALLPVWGNWQGFSQSQAAGAELKQMIRLARAASLAGYRQARHGVYLEIDPTGIDRAIYYQGSAYPTRSVDYDQELLLPAALSLVTDIPGQDLNFYKDTGLPTATGTITLIDNSNGVQQWRLNDLGIIIDN